MRSEDDLAGYVQQTEHWEVVRFAAIAEADEEHIIDTPYRRERYMRRAGEALHPEREPLDALEAIRLSMGSYDFAAQYQQDPNSPTGGIIKRAWLKVQPPELWRDKFDHVYQSYQSWDTANTATEISNYSVCVTIGVKGKNFFVIHVYRKRHEFPDLLRAVERLYREYEPCSVVVEDAASGVQLVQEMKDRGLYKIKAMKPEGEKEMRLYAQAHEFEGGYVYLPAGAVWLEDYVRELTSFPGGKFSDQVDATTQALAWIKGPGHEPGIIGFYRTESEESRGINQPSTPLNAPAGVTEVHTIVGRKVKVDLYGTGWFTTEEAKYVRLEGWTPAPHRAANIAFCISLKAPHRKRVHHIHGRAVRLDEDGVGQFTESEAEELLEVGWKRV